MLTFLKQDLTTVERGVIAHGVNCQGVMGSGVALALRNKWPAVYTNYRTMVDASSDEKEKLLGTCSIVAVERTNHLYVANVFSQVNYGRQRYRYANPEAIRSGLNFVFSFATGIGLPVYMPKLGCGLGGLSWYSDVEPVVAELLDKHPNLENVFLCEISNG